MPPTKDMNMVERALTIAYEVHFKQRSFSKRPYLFHLIRVMEQMGTDEERAVALLHDVLEDGDLPVEALAIHFPPRVVEAVVALTKAPDPDPNDEDDCDYDDYVEARQKAYNNYITQQVARNPLATKVKLADLRDNMRVERLSKMTKGAFHRLKKYHKALTFLLNRSS